MKVRATRTGYDGIKRRKEDEEFDWPADKKLGSWVEPTDPKAAKALAEIEKEKERAEHARLMRESIGAVVPLTPAAPAADSK